MYNNKYTQAQSYKKFDKMLNLVRILMKINNKINDLYTVKDLRINKIAIILKLIMECQFRIGNDVYSKKINHMEQLLYKVTYKS